MDPHSAIPYAALDKQAKEIKKELMAAFETVLDSGQYILGPAVQNFEREFAQYCQTRYSAGVSNGTSALLLTLKELGAQPGDEVITAPNSFIASASSIVLAGARPVFADIGKDLNLDPVKVEAAVTPRTKGIMAVHLTGRPARMQEILAIAKKHRLWVLEDAAQSIGAKLNNKPVGSWGNAGCFSLHPLKNLHAYGDGGMVTTHDGELHSRILKSRNHGLKNREECEFWSYNCRLDELQAAMLTVQLRHLDRRTEERRRLAFGYNEKLAPYVEVPAEGPGEYCVYQTYMIQADNRDALRQFLNDHGVGATVHYTVPIPLQPAAKNLGYSAKDFPETMKAASRILSLPLYPGLTVSQQDRIVGLVAEFYKQSGRRK